MLLTVLGQPVVNRVGLPDETQEMVRCFVLWLLLRMPIYICILSVINGYFEIFTTKQVNIASLDIMYFWK